MLTTNRGSLFMFAGALAVAIPCSSALATENAGDAQISAAVQSKLEQRPALAFDELHVQTLDQTVYLYGSVDTVLERHEAKAIALGVPGVARVVNSVDILRGPG